MLSLGWPLALLALPLPALAAWLLPAAAPGGGRALRVPFFDAVATPAGAARRFRARLPLLLAVLAWLALVAAATRPQWLGDARGHPVTGRDLLMAVDLSGSMKTRDMRRGNVPVSRLFVVQQVAGEFIERRVGDRIGLVLFGTRAYLQAPLTFDRRTVRTLLDEAVIGLAGEQTAIGDAIGLAVKRLRERPQANRVLILLTDGANTAGAVEPLQAAALAASAGLRIYTIGVGAEEMAVRRLFGTQRINPSSDLDEETLQDIARYTGGRYFRARDPVELEQIYAALDTLEPARREDELLRPADELYPWPLGVALAASAALALALAGAARRPARARAHPPDAARGWPGHA